MPNDDLLNNFSELNKLNGLKVISLNIRSLLPKINILRTDLQDLGIDFVTLSKTWLKEGVINELLRGCIIDGIDHL